MKRTHCAQASQPRGRALVSVQVDVRVFDGGCAGLYHLRLEDHTRRALPPHLGAQRLAWQHRRREACAHRVEARLVRVVELGWGWGLGLGLGLGSGLGVGSGLGLGVGVGRVPVE